MTRRRSPGGQRRLYTSGPEPVECVRAHINAVWYVSPSSPSADGRRARRRELADPVTDEEYVAAPATHSSRPAA